MMSNITWLVGGLVASIMILLVWLIRRRAGYRIDTAGSVAKVYERLREKTEQTYRAVLKNFAERALKTKMPQGVPGALVEKLEPLLIAEVSRRDRSAAALLKLLS